MRKVETRRRRGNMGSCKEERWMYASASFLSYCPLYAKRMRILGTVHQGNKGEREGKKEAIWRVKSSEEKKNYESSSIEDNDA